MCPIQGLTSDVAPGFERVGRLFKGGPKRKTADGKTYPGEELPYFRFESDNPEVVAAFTAAYGGQPDTIRVILPFETAEQVFSTWREEWSAGGLVHRCDGQVMTLWRDPQTGEMRHEPRPCAGLTCKQVGRLAVIVPELLAAGYLGTVTMATHSKHDLMSLTGAMRAAELVCGSRPRGLFGVAGIIRRKKAKISTPAGDGKRASREKWLVVFELEAFWVREQLQLAYQERREPLQLGDGRRLDPATGEILGPNPDTATEPARCPDGAPPDFDEDGEPLTTPPTTQPSTMPRQMPTGRPWSSARVLEVLRKHVTHEGGRGDVPPIDGTLGQVRSSLEGLIGVEGALGILRIAFDKSGWEGLSKAQVEAVARKWLLIDRQGAICNPAAAEEAQALMATVATESVGEDVAQNAPGERQDSDRGAPA